MKNLVNLRRPASVASLAGLTLLVAGAVVFLIGWLDIAEILGQLGLGLMLASAFSDR